MNDALKEANRNVASDRYFNARPQIDIRDRRNVFESGFDRGWEAAQNAATQTDERSAMLDGRPKDNVPAANSLPAVAAPDAQDAELIMRLRTSHHLPNCEASIHECRSHCRCRGEDEKLAAARIEQLERELDQWAKWNIVEIAIRNPSVMDYMKHWEGRAEKAEAAIAEREGMVMVPREPTDAMFKAGIHAMVHSGFDDIYKAMIAAAEAK